MYNIIDDNFNLHACKIPGLTNGMKVLQLPGLTYVDSGLSCDTFNIIHITNGSTAVAGDIQQAVHYYTARQLAFCVWICRENLTATVMAAFEQLHLKQQNAEPGMLLHLDGYQPVHPPAHTSAIVANNITVIEDYAAVTAANWSPPDGNVIAYYKKAAPAILNNAQHIHFAVFYESGQPASVIEMFGTNNAVVGLYGLATLQSHRGKGIGTALMQFALNNAKALGYKQVILQASEDGLGIYSKLGFEVMTTYYEFA